MLAKRKSRRTKLSKDPRTGRWCAKLGRKQTRGGRSDGHFFRFSTDEKESERRKMKVQEFWDHLVEHCKATQWNDETLAIAKALADGQTKVPISVDQVADVSETENGSAARFDYVLGLEKLRTLYPQVDFVPADAEAYQVGSEEVAQLGEQLSDEGKLFVRAATGHDGYEDHHVRKGGKLWLEKRPEIELATTTCDGLVELSMRSVRKEQKGGYSTS